MKQFLAIIEETYREASSKKTIVGFFIFSTVLILIGFFVFQSTSVQDTMRTIQTHKVDGRGGAMASVVQMMALDIFYMIISSLIFFFTLCIGVFATTGFITSQMEKGTIDLLLSKPVPKWKYILGRFTACVSIVFLECCWLVLGLWVVVSVGTGIWNNTFLMSVVYITLGFAGVYSVIILVSVLSRSSALSIIAGLGLYFISWLISIGHKVEALTGSSGKSTLGTVAGIFYYVFPQASDMSDNMTNAVIGKPVEVLPIALILGLTVVYLGLGIYVFEKKEF